MPMFGVRRRQPSPLFRQEWKSDTLRFRCDLAVVVDPWGSRIATGPGESVEFKPGAKTPNFPGPALGLRVDAASQAVRGGMGLINGMEPASDQFARLTYRSE